VTGIASQEISESAYIKQFWQPMENGQCIEEHIQQMRDSERMVSAFHDSRRGEDINDGHCGNQEDARDSRQCLEEPIGNGRQKVGAEDSLKWMEYTFFLFLLSNCQGKGPLGKDRPILPGSAWPHGKS